MRDIVLSYWNWFAVDLNHDEIIAISAITVAVFTAVLSWVGLKQTRDARVLQRAYLNVKFGGIGSNPEGELVGQVIFINVGHLPAQKFSWLVKLDISGKDWQPPKIRNKDLVGESVIPVGADWPKGSAGPRPDDHFYKGLYLYVWGRATYKDGFRWRKRYTNFCHSYPWEMRETPTGGGVSISTEYACYHQYGNSAT